MNSGHASSGFETNNFPSANVGSLASQSHNSENILTHNPTFGNTGVMRSDNNQISSSAVPSQFPSATSSQPLDVSNMAEVQTRKNIHWEKISGDMSIWLKEKWTPGEVPEEEPPDAVVNS